MFLFPMPPKIAQMALGKEGNNSMFNPNLGGLFRGSFLRWGRGGGVKLYPCLKLVRSKLET